MKTLNLLDGAKWPLEQQITWGFTSSRCTGAVAHHLCGHAASSKPEIVESRKGDEEEDEGKGSEAKERAEGCRHEVSRQESARRRAQAKVARRRPVLGPQAAFEPAGAGRPRVPRRSLVGAARVRRNGWDHDEDAEQVG